MLTKMLQNEIYLSTLASICDPLGFVSPCLLLRKIIYRNLCDLKVSWDREIPIEIQTQWLKWITGLETKIKIPRSIFIKNEPITEINIHLFSDASIVGVCTVAYAVVDQRDKGSQSIITSKSRIAKKNISIPRRAPIAAHMFPNLAWNLKCSLSKFNIREVYAWSDSIVTLHWLKDNGAKSVWLRDPNSWPDQPIIESSEESEIERKRVKEILAGTVTSETIYDKLWVKYPLLKTLRILSWIKRFLISCKKQQLPGPLTSRETEYQREFLIMEEQHQYNKCEKFELSQ